MLPPNSSVEIIFCRFCSPYCHSSHCSMTCSFLPCPGDLGRRAWQGLQAVLSSYPTAPALRAVRKQQPGRIRKIQMAEERSKPLIRVCLKTAQAGWVYLDDLWSVRQSEWLQLYAGECLIQWNSLHASRFYFVMSVNPYKHNVYPLPLISCL